MFVTLLCRFPYKSTALANNFSSLLVDYQISQLPTINLHGQLNLPSSRKITRLGHVKFWFSGPLGFHTLLRWSESEDARGDFLPVQALQGEKIHSKQGVFLSISTGFPESPQKIRQSPAQTLVKQKYAPWWQFRTHIRKRDAFLARAAVAICPKLICGAVYLPNQHAWAKVFKR
jgi:hypothetical protein